MQQTCVAAVIKIPVFGQKHWKTADGSMTSNMIILDQNHCILVPLSFFFFFPSFSFFLVGKLLEPFKKWLFMVQTWKSNYACFSSALPWPVLQSANQQHPPWKASRHIHGYSATHLENPNVDLNVFWNSLQRCSQPSFKFLKISLPSVQVIMVLRTYSNRVIRLRAAFSTATHLLLCNGRRDRYHADFPHSFSE